MAPHEEDGHSCASDSGGGQEKASRPGGDHAATADGRAGQGQGTAAICCFVASEASDSREWWQRPQRRFRSAEGLAATGAAVGGVAGARNAVGQKWVVLSLFSPLLVGVLTYPQLDVFSHFHRRCFKYLKNQLRLCSLPIQKHLSFSTFIIWLAFSHTGVLNSRATLPLNRNPAIKPKSK